MHNHLINVKVHELVAYEIDLEIIDNLERSALHITIDANNVSMIEALLECHIDTSIRDKKNNMARSYLNNTKCSTNTNLNAQILQFLDKWDLKRKWELKYKWELKNEMK